MEYRYPVDVADLVRRAKKRGDEFVRTAGLRDDLRDDEKLRAITDAVSLAWFPLTFDRRFHDGLDIGLPRVKGDADQDYEGTPVFAVTEGEVLEAIENVWSEEGLEHGRVLIRHQTPQGKHFYVQYRHLTNLQVSRRGSTVKPGTMVGYVGRHGDFPHVGVSVASRVRIGDEETLGPSYHSTALPVGEAAWGVHCVEMSALDRGDWPIQGLGGEHGFLYDAIELVRFCRNEPYRHFVGPGSPHAVSFQSKLGSFGLGQDGNLTLDVSLLSYPALRDNPILHALAQDREFKPLERAGALAEHAVMAVQDALHAVRFSVGRKGPDPDKPGKDGAFGDATERALVQFQKTFLKKLVDAAKPPSLLANMGSKLRTDGKLDWPTLLGLDACAHALSQVIHPSPKPPKAPAAAPATSPPAPPATTPAASTAGPSAAAAPPPLSNTFDAKGPLSIHFGIRMYKQLLKWVWDGEWDEQQAAQEAASPYFGTKKYFGKRVGVGYSTCNIIHYTTYNANQPGTVAQQAKHQLEQSERAIHNDFQSEWPDIGLEALRVKQGGNPGVRTVEGVSYPLYRAWDCSWVGNNYTNCCNSQLAALACALVTGKDGLTFRIHGGEEFGRDRGDATDTYSIHPPAGSDEKKLKVQYTDGGVTHSQTVNVIRVIGASWVAYPKYRTKKPGQTGYTEELFNPMHATLSAMNRVGMGSVLFTLDDGDQTDDNFRKMLLGDQGATGGHSWLVGDVRYGVWVAGGRPPNKAPKYVVDQASFLYKADGHPQLLVEDDIKKARTMPGRGPDGQPVPDLKPPLLEKDCDWLMSAANEAAFTARVAAFLSRDPAGSGGQAGMFQGEQVTRIRPISYRCFSGNTGAGNYKWVVHSMQLKLVDGKIVRLDPDTKNNFKQNGVTCAFRNFHSAGGKNIAVARFFRPLP